MYQNQHHQHGTIDSDEYKKFAAAVANVFSKDWAKIQPQFDACMKFLPSIPNEAWRPMAGIAAESWESWPRNMVRAIKDTYYTWKADAKIARDVTDCEYCNSIGYFSGGIQVEVKPGVRVWYWYTWRCAACSNWRGVVGKRIPDGYPLEIKSRGYEIRTFSKPQADGERRSLSSMIEMAGRRVNEKVSRPAIQEYYETESHFLGD